jgi:hypothetical protein
MYLIKGRYKKRDGSYYTFWVLRETVWDRAQKRSVQRYVAYVGPKRTITLQRAQALAKKIGCTVDDLRRVRGLKIVE